MYEKEIKNKISRIEKRLMDLVQLYGIQDIKLNITESNYEDHTEIEDIKIKYSL